MKAKFTLALVALFLTTSSFATTLLKDTKAKRGLYFQVRIDNAVEPDLKQVAFETIESRDNATFIGIFKSYTEAQKVKNVLTYTEHIETASIIPFFNDEEITIEDALVLSNNQIFYDNELSIGNRIVSQEEISKLLFAYNGEVQLEYKVLIGLFVNPIQIPNLSGDIAILQRRTEEGFVTYEIGNFKSKERAAEYISKLRKAGINGGVYAPYLGGKRVSALLAQQFEKLSNDYTAMETVR